MATLPLKYPSGCTDAVIEQTIAEIAKDISAAQGDINVVLQLVPLQAIGLIELQRRSLDRLNQVTADALRASERNNRWATWLTIGAIVLTFVSILYAWETSATDKQWLRDEIGLLEGIRGDNQRAFIADSTVQSQETNLLESIRDNTNKQRARK